MPKVKLAKFAKEEIPPIDWLWAAVLERQAVYGYDLKTMASTAGVSYEMMRRYIRRSPWTWPYDARINICEAFNIQTEVIIGDKLNVSPGRVGRRA